MASSGAEKSATTQSESSSEFEAVEERISSDSISDDYEIVQPSVESCKTVVVSSSREPPTDAGHMHHSSSGKDPAKDVASAPDDGAGETPSNTSLANENTVEDDKSTTATKFQGVDHLGFHVVDDPKNEAEIHALIETLNREPPPPPGSCKKGTTVGVPADSTGSVLLFGNGDDNGPTERFPVFRIIFFARGCADSAACFAFTVASTSTVAAVPSPETAAGNGSNVKVSFHCHVFRCAGPEVVNDVFVAFARAFKKPSSRPTPSDGEPPEAIEHVIFQLSMEIKELENGGGGSSSAGNGSGTAGAGHGGYAANASSGSGGGPPGMNGYFEGVPRQKGGVFKLRCNVEKKVILSVHQVSSDGGCRLLVERCFGMLVSPGRNVRHADMQLLEHVTMANSCNAAAVSDDAAAASSAGEQRAKEAVIYHVITGTWDPKESAFAMLNKETPAEMQSVYLTIAADLVVSQVAEPIRFVVETQARIYPQSERYWYYTKRNLVKQYRVSLRPRAGETEDGNGKTYDLVGIDISEEISEQQSKSRIGLGGLSLPYFKMPNYIRSSTSSFMSTTSAQQQSSDPLASVSPTLTVEDDDTDDNEPMLSGFGEVSKDCSGSELDTWSQMLQEWDRVVPGSKPKNLAALVRTLGVPEALRGVVWQHMTGASLCQDEIVATYRILITKESPDDKVIQRDINRTFPAHDFFKDAGGNGQESLYRIAKAYSVYDAEIGYCQGQSFLIAALLLQMPEEQAFGVLVKVMRNLGLRDMFRENFEQLQLRLYQLERLIEHHLPDLAAHFAECGVEAHMYASQWFLTIFTAKFPLFLVFRVLDVFLLEGFEVVFQVAIAILKVSKRELLQQDFEGLMKYFRVNIPKMYRNDDNAKHLMSVASAVKISKLKKYQKDWLSLKAQERAQEDPLVRLDRENKKLLSENFRLDTENDSLARELVNSKIDMRREIDAAEDARENAENELEGLKSLLSEAIEERKRLEVETEQLKSLFKREISKLDAEIATKSKVISEYKSICSQLSEKLEKAQRHPGLPPNSEGQAVAEVGHCGDGREDLLADDREKRTSSSFSDEDRVKVLELELAETKLALVQSECKNQELVHCLNTQMGGEAPSSSSSQHQKSAGGTTWLSKTLSSIRETAAAAAQAATTNAAAASPPAAAVSATTTAATSSSAAVSRSVSMGSTRSQGHSSDSSGAKDRPNH